MPQYIVKRIFLMIPTLVALSIFIFVLIQLPPGSYLDAIVTELESQGESVSQDQIESLEERYGFNEPVYASISQVGIRLGRVAISARRSPTMANKISK